MVSECACFREHALEEGRVATVLNALGGAAGFHALACATFRRLAARAMDCTAVALLQSTAHDDDAVEIRASKRAEIRRRKRSEDCRTRLTHMYLLRSLSETCACTLPHGHQKSDESTPRYHPAGNTRETLRCCCETDVLAFRKAEHRRHRFPQKLRQELSISKRARHPFADHC